MHNKSYSRVFILLALAILFTGCVSSPMPVPKDYQGPLARISDSSAPVSSTKIYLFQLSGVDDRTVETSSEATYRKNYGHGFALEPQIVSREVPATKCTLKISGTTYVAAPILAFGGGMYHVEGAVTTTLEATKVYFVKGALGKDYSAVWIEDSEGHVVSNKIEKGTRP